MGAATRGGTGRGRAIPLLLLLLPVAFLLASTAHAVVFTLPSARTKCITRHLRGAGATSVARYRVAYSGRQASHNHTIYAGVRDPEGKSIRQAESVEFGEVAFVAEKTGRYGVCLWSPRSEGVASISIDFEWGTGNATQSSSSVARERKTEVPAQTQEVPAGKQPLQGSNSFATMGAKASTTTGEQAAMGDSEDEQDDDDDTEDGGEGGKN